MGGWEIAYVNLIILLFYFIFKNLNIENFHGKNIMRLTNNRISIFWSIILVISYIILLFNMIPSYYNGIKILLQCLFWATYSTEEVISTKNYSIITESGIFLKSGFSKWSKFRSYQWVSSNTIRFKIKSIDKYSFYEEFEIPQSKKEKLNEILTYQLTSIGN